MTFLRVIIFCLALLPSAAFAAELGTARISLIKGDVQIFTDDTGEWVAASINMPLKEGDRIWVPEGSRTEIHIQGGVYIRLGSASSLDIMALQEESYQFYLNGGHAYINNRKGGIDHIQVDTPRSSVGCYDSSIVMIDVAQNGATDVSVLKGYAAAESQEGKTSVDAGNTLHIGVEMAAELSPLAPPDEWENWNRKRDKKLAAGSRSLRYIPEELDDYAYELDDYGRWVYLSDYGYCWTPYRVSVGWSPYRYGRWCWVGGDYVWISYDPWGWVPHHYGRWTFVVNFGWCWVPPSRGGVYWSPGYVGWVNTPTYVAWVPLAPGDIFYGRGNYGPGSVNITNVTVNRTVIQNFTNVNVQNAVTIVSSNTFISGRKEAVRIKGNPFREANVNVGPPVVKPTRTTAMPVIRSIPMAKRPPEQVRRVSVDEIRRERKLVREEKGSAFRPERPGVVMPVKSRNEPQAKVREEHPALPQERPTWRSRPVQRREWQPPVKTPEIIKGRPMVQPATPEPPAERLKREPRWQEPVPNEKPSPPPRYNRPARPAEQSRPKRMEPGRRPPETKGAPKPSNGHQEKQKKDERKLETKQPSKEN